MQGATNGKPGDGRSVDVGGDRAAAAGGGGVRAAAGGVEREAGSALVDALAEKVFRPAAQRGIRAAFDAAAGRLERERQQISDEVEAAFGDGAVAARSARMMAAGLTFEWVQFRVKRLERIQMATAVVGLGFVLLAAAWRELWLVPGGVGLAGVSVGLGWAVRSLREVVRRHDDTAEFLHGCLGKRRTP